MKKVYLLAAAAATLLFGASVNAQITHNVRYDLTSVSIQGADGDRKTIEAGDTIHFYIGSSGNLLLSTVGAVPSPSDVLTNVELSDGEGDREGIFYVVEAPGEYNFATDGDLLEGGDDNVYFTVVPNGGITQYPVRVPASGFQIDELTIEVGDTAHIFVPGDGDVAQTIRTTVAPANSLADTTIDFNEGATTGIYYVPTAPGTYTFTSTTTGSTALTTTFNLFVLASNNGITGRNESVVFEGISFYPNPAKEMLNVNLNPSYNYDLSITDLNGTTLSTQKVNNANNATFNINNLNKGSYILMISNGKSNAKGYKFIKE